MSIEYSGLELTNIFDSHEKLETCDVVEYRLNIKGSIFLLRIFLAERRASMMLLSGVWEGPVFEVSISDINKISCSNRSIEIYNQKKKDKAFSVIVKPCVVLQCSDLSRVSFITKHIVAEREVFSAYQDQEILELFGEVCFIHEDNTIVSYRKSLKDGSILQLGVWRYDEVAFLTLIRDNQEDFIFDVKIEQLHKLERDGDKLKFYKNENQNVPALTLVFKPQISMQCDVATPSEI